MAMWLWPYLRMACSDVSFNLVDDLFLQTGDYTCTSDLSLIIMATPVAQDPGIGIASATLSLSTCAELTAMIDEGLGNYAEVSGLVQNFRGLNFSSWSDIKIIQKFYPSKNFPLHGTS